MKIALALVCLTLFGFTSIEHADAFAAGSIVALLSLTACYWIAFRPTKVPEFALGLLFLGLMTKLMITSLGLSVTFLTELASSPMVAVIAYFYTSVAATIYWYRHRQTHSNTDGMV
ncbi:NADH:ubiquinone oxidoreductase subunit 2 [Vibrio astriarenae]|uniref:NADH:ubiquinone oxidoreductase n=1 Tax=Vibrio astriarenae TaxID=1481923 RepID=UPI00050752DD|nr:NADH:ubiquinone oxidoreductase subunit 2 [Vibrio sp. C7]